MLLLFFLSRVRQYKERLCSGLSALKRGERRERTQHRVLWTNVPYVNQGMWTKQEYTVDLR